LASHTAGWDVDWPFGREVPDRYLSRVEELFGVAPGPFEGDLREIDPAPGALKSFTARAPKWPTFKNRNVATILDAQILKNRQLRVFLNANVTRLLFDGGRFSGFRAKALGGRKLLVEAPVTLIAAGAIESTRALLVAASMPNGPQFAPTLGRYFHDHLSAVAGYLDPIDKSGLSRCFSFRFIQGGMRNWRLELSGRTRAAERLPAAFAHVAFRIPENGGFDALRIILRSVQQASLPPAGVVMPLLAELPWLAASAYWRVVYRTLLPPTGANFDLHLVTEQEPRSRNRITLSTSRRDAFGIPLASIDWEVGQCDIASFLSLQDRLLGEWAYSANGGLAVVHKRPMEGVVDDLVSGGGIFHPAGGTRMGRNPKTSVLDEYLAPHGMKGLRVVSTSAFPSIGGANPSLTLLCLALRTAEQVDRELGSAVSIGDGQRRQPQPDA